MTTSFLPRLRPRYNFDIRPWLRQARSRLQRHREMLNLATGLILSGAFLATLFLGCSLLLLELIASAAAPAARELGIGS